MTDTANLGLPCIEGRQAQKHVTHNDALRILDTLVQLAVLDRDLTAPPSSPAEGQRWIVKTGASGVWAGHVNAIAAWQDGAWIFSTPQTGWVAFVADEGALLVWNGTAWGDFFSTVTSIQNLALLGIGTTADSTNPLSAKLNNALFVAKTVTEGGDGNLRYKLNKESVSKTLSFLLQDNYSGRAEIGLTGDDDFHFKVSPDGSAWYEGIKIAATTGKVSFPVSGGPREMLTANRIYYVRTDGSDSNNGLANTSGGAFLTLQHAYDVVCSTLDLGGYTITIQVADGTYAGGLLVSQPWTGGGAITIQGNTGTPDNVVVSASIAFKNTAPLPGVLTIVGFKLTGAGGIEMGAAGVINWGNINFATSSIGINLIAPGANAVCIANWSVSASMFAVFTVFAAGAFIQISNFTCTVVGTPAWSGGFVYVRVGYLAASAFVFSGAGATGPRYVVQNNGVIDTGGGGANYFPGNSAGSGTNSGVSPYGLYL